MGVAGCPGLCFWVLCCDVSLGSWVGWHSVTLGNIWKVQVNWKLIIPQLSTRKYINRLSQQNLFWGGGWSICKQPAQYLLYPTINLMIPYVSQKKENTMSFEDYPPMLYSIPTRNPSCFVWCRNPTSQRLSVSQTPPLSTKTLEVNYKTLR